ncbi:hypothetical protein ACUR5C_14795 [Aliikangiella sp. IMCC44653]
MFNIKFQVRDINSLTPSQYDKEPAYDAEFDDVNALLSDICELMQVEGKFSFSVSGFGDLRWPVDIGTDFCTFLEQLPEAFDQIDKDSGEFEIDFYEQGLERRLVFSITGQDIVIECLSATNWNPSPSRITLGKEQVRTLLSNVYNNFKEFVGTSFPLLTSHKWFKEY